MELNDLPINEQIEHYFLLFKSSPGSSKAYHSSGSATKHFIEAEQRCRELKADPYDFVASVFANKDQNRILPAFLHGKNVEADYVKYMSTKVKTDLDSVYKYNVRLLKEQLDKGFTEEEILLTKLINFEPWFRLCYPTTYYPSIKKKWHKLGIEQNSESLRTFLFSKGHQFTRLFE